MTKPGVGGWVGGEGFRRLRHQPFPAKDGKTLKFAVTVGEEVGCGPELRDPLVPFPLP